MTQVGLRADSTVGDPAADAARRATRVGAVGVGAREFSAVWVGPDDPARPRIDETPGAALALHAVSVPPPLRVRIAPQLLELSLGGPTAAHAARYLAQAFEAPSGETR